MKCLNCDQEMAEKLAQTERGQVYYDICEACGGIWLDAGELDSMALQVFASVEGASKDKAEGISERSKKCPRCVSTRMDKVFFLAFSEILLDHCRNCGGFWLDGGELDLINEELQKLKREPGKVWGFLEGFIEGFFAGRPPGGYPGGYP